jgi:exodeoxyribonuclease VII small subunit
MDVPFEQLMAQLEAIVKELENDALGLEKSIAAYQKGMELSKQIAAKLQQAKDLLVERADD